MAIKKFISDKPESKGEEILMEMGQDNEKKAAKAVTEVLSEKDKRDSGYQDMLKDRAKMFLKRKSTYITWLRDVLFHNMSRVDWGVGWMYRVTAEEEGIHLEVFAPGMQKYQKALKPIGDPEMDLHALEMFVVFTENTVDMVERRGVDGGTGTDRRLPGSNIILPS